MTCKETQTLMDGYLDRELDLMRIVDLERHLHDCAACTELHRARMAVRAAMGTATLRYQAPAALKSSVRRKIAQTERKFRFGWTPFLAAVATVLVVAGIFFRPESNRVEREVLDSHIRSLMAGHLTDVVSTDQHTVKPWFAGKIDLSPPVQDFAEQGFPLVGGRMDYFGDHPAAVVVYRKNQHVINVFTWRSSEPARSPRTIHDHGYNIIEFVRDGTAYWVVSDLNEEELDQFARLALGT